MLQQSLCLARGYICSRKEKYNAKTNGHLCETITDIKDHRVLILVIDHFEIEYILDYLGYPASDDENPIECSGLLVLVRDGDCEEVYSFSGEEHIKIAYI